MVYLTLKCHLWASLHSLSMAVADASVFKSVWSIFGARVTGSGAVKGKVGKEVGSEASASDASADHASLVSSILILNRGIAAKIKKLWFRQSAETTATWR